MSRSKIMGRSSARPEMFEVSSAKTVNPPQVISEVQQRIQNLLDREEPAEAFRLAVGRSGGSLADKNAQAVCLMRLGKPAEAVNLLRQIVVQPGMTTLREAAPLTCKINFAIALALAGNAAGAVAVLGELSSLSDPRLGQLKLAIHNWEKSLTWPEWLQWKTGITVDRPVAIEFPAGELV